MKILLADSNKELLRTILHAKEAKQYQFDLACTGKECLEKCKSFKPDLLLIDLHLPEIHAIEILKRARQKNPKLGLIVTSAQAMVQNYHACINSGADYFLEKPFDLQHLFEVFHHFFQGTLKPAPFSGKESTAHKKQESYIPHPHTENSYIKFWGTRGSNPVAGREYIRYGGNTPCLEIRHKKDLVIVDAGTGIRSLCSDPFLQQAEEIHLLIGHTHWDHIIGFPFFCPIYNPDLHIIIYSPIGYEKTTKELFTEMLAYAYFPIRLDDVRAKLTFKEIQESVPFSIGDIHVNTHYAYHPGSTLSFKFTVGKTTFGYATDNEMLMGFHGAPKEVKKDHPLLQDQASLVTFFKECNFLIHEAQYFPDEYKKKVGWGHSSISNASVLLRECGIPDWIVTHHDPQHTDEDLQKKFQLHNDILADNKIPCKVRFAFDGLKIPL